MQLAQNIEGADLGKMIDEIEALLIEPIEGITREERQSELESDSFAAFSSAMGS